MDHSRDFVDRGGVTSYFVSSQSGAGIQFKYDTDEDVTVDSETIGHRRRLNRRRYTASGTDSECSRTRGRVRRDRSGSGGAWICGGHVVSGDRTTVDPYRRESVGR